MSIVRMGRWLWDSETGEFFEPLIGAKGSVSTPPPTPEETALQKKQLELLNTQQLWALQQQQEQQSLSPYLYAQMGLKRVADPTHESRITDLTTQLQAAQAEFAKMKAPTHNITYTTPSGSNDPRAGGGQQSYQNVHPLTPQQQAQMDAYKAKQAQVQSLSSQLNKQKNTPIKYTFTKMSPEELRAQMSPEEVQAADIRNLANQRTLKALQGNLDVDPSVEADIQRGQAQLRQELLQKLGPGAEGSDSWNRAMSEFDRNMNALRYSVRYGEMTTSDAIATNRVNESLRRQEQALGNIQDSTRNYSVSAATLSGAGQGMDSALSRFYGMRRDAAGIAQQNAASQGAATGGYISAGAGVVGAGIGAAALIAI